MIDIAKIPALPEKLQLPVLGLFTVLGSCAVFYVAPSDWWVKRLFSWFWGSLVEDIKADWREMLVIVGILILFRAWDAFMDYLHPPRRFTMEDLEDF